MQSSVSVRRLTAALTASGVLYCISLLPAAEPEPFHATVIVTITFVEGDTLEGELVGESSPGGAFVGALHERLVGFGTGAVGTVTYQYESGSSLTFFFVDTVLPDGSLQGAWNVIGGTGEFAGAEGGGELTGFFLDPFTAAVEITGSIVR